MIKSPSLKALAEDKNIEGVSKETFFSLDPDIVEIEPGFNLREDTPELREHMERMYLAMKNGVPMPPIDVVVHEGHVIVRRGHCRTINAKRLKAEGIDYRLSARHYRGNDADQIFDMIGENDGLHFSPLELGRGYLRLLNMGFSIAQIAERRGVSRPTVENGLALAEAPVAVQKMIAEGKVAAHTALQTVRQEGEGAAEKLAQGVAAAEKAGKKKATGKHINGPKVRGQTLPPASTAEHDFIERLAARSPLVTYTSRDFLDLITEARGILEGER